jgi:branched-chain amino acid transport system ATP-binding protein
VTRCFSLLGIPYTIIRATQFLEFLGGIAWRSAIWCPALGRTAVLNGVSLTATPGCTLAVLGRNGAGKTTLFATLMGLTTLRGGMIRMGGRAVDALPTHRRARLGLGYVSQKREIFSSLTVIENLAVAALPRGWPLDRVFALFPLLAECRRTTGNRLSGGEQQMLAIARAVVGGPKILLLDEPLEGLAPIVVENLFAALLAIRDNAGVTARQPSCGRTKRCNTDCWRSAKRDGRLAHPRAQNRLGANGSCDRTIRPSLS